MNDRLSFRRSVLSLAMAVLFAGASAPLSVAAESRLPGKFVWADLVTDRVPAARAFYSGLFGWKFHGRGNYLVATNHGHPVAGLLHKDRPAGKPAATPRWFGYLSVADVKRTEQAVTAGGGRVILPAADVPGRGTQAVFADPEGALFGAIHTTEGDPPDATARVGDWVWIQLLSRDAARSSSFYRKVGGYRVQRNHAENRSSDFVLSIDGINRATVRTIPSNRPKVQPTWLPFVRVTDLAASVNKAKQLGGQVMVSPRSDLMEGKVAVVADPTGAAIGLMEWNPQ